MNVTVIGGGIIGLSTAYYLSKEGCQVTVLEQGKVLDGCSFGNAGMIVPSHIIPLAAPGMISKGIRWMFNARSPFYVRPRISPTLFKWGLHFYKAANHTHVSNAIPLLRDLSLFSKSLYQELMDDLQLPLQHKGLLMLYKTDHMEEEEGEAALLAQKAGLEAQILSASEVATLENNCTTDVKGAVYYPGDAHLNPAEVLQQLYTNLLAKGVKILENTTVTQFVQKGNKIQGVITNQGMIDADEVVVATGAWAGDLVEQLGLNLPMQAGKGYSITQENVKNNLSIPSILTEAKVAMTPMGNSLRIAGTMEIAGVDFSVNTKRVEGIVQAVEKYYPQHQAQIPEDKTKIWKGLRPCSPDGLPYIGRSNKFTNVSIAAGHAMMGVSLAPATGKLIAELLTEQKGSLSLEGFSPNRYERKAQLIAAV
ncbi:NAD(P)/FAD-dependent oxidoreductase [Algivirga pacifica]|uniref:FAD-dependent oxidoreductase n=1 Tax=Algivirga pacifica TaxID=1162670 RepID=A0ABP9D8D1_9BACT